ncbi:HTH-type transcriptional regulator PuuR [Sporomusa ovata DSM 2662]|uniref:Transcriptional regulator, MerR family, near polyamine transporter n=1 Tax=Sporomusa ovata TaxID=2378 RepID=A0A0U1KUC2_9FIRM|nr:helix-turn-helix transcriptional regulator [Sporomusa ovata]EQB26954.1 putative transcriptional regulator [Sporomusa ovata DSM 2662]CQR71060.1 Transcriptional regulator, MerR family, near polyamine transporter [Sporomusa ovata]
MSKIGYRLRDLRLQKKLTMKEVAEIAGIAQSSLSYIENGNNSPSIETLETILMALGITMGEFFSEEKPELEPELRRLLDTAKKLTPEQRELAQRLLEALGKD